MEEAKFPIPDEPKPVGESLTAYLQLLEASELRKLELERLQAEVKQMRVVQQAGAAARAEHVANVTARLTIVEAKERGTRNRLVVCSQCLKKLLQACDTTSDALPYITWAQDMDNAIREARELVRVLMNENIL